MSKAEIIARQQQKHDIEANWQKAINFIPLAGEFIVYEPDEAHPYARYKIGDGVLNPTTGKIEGTNINNLPFINPKEPLIITQTSGGLASHNSLEIQAAVKEGREVYFQDLRLSAIDLQDHEHPQAWFNYITDDTGEFGIYIIDIDKTIQDIMYGIPFYWDDEGAKYDAQSDISFQGDIYFDGSVYYRNDITIERPTTFRQGGTVLFEDNVNFHSNATFNSILGVDEGQFYISDEEADKPISQYLNERYFAIPNTVPQNGPAIPTFTPEHEIQHIEATLYPEEGLIPYRNTEGQLYGRNNWNEIGTIEEREFITKGMCEALISQALNGVEATLDDIIEAQNNLINIRPLITFYIGDIVCTAENGMTWADYIDSGYNTINAKTIEATDGSEATWVTFSQYDADYGDFDGGPLCHDDELGTIVTPTHAIIPEMNYYYM